jgi:sigma-E factor negative regulatory protein RseC
MESEATVIRLEGADALVELLQASGGCGRCHEAGGCGGGASAIGQMLGPRCRIFRVRNSIQALPGDRVVVRMGEKEILRVALAVYLLPVILLVAGAYAAMALSASPGDAGAMIGAIAGLAAGIASVMVFQARERRLGRLQPVLARSSSSAFRVAAINE